MAPHLERGAAIVTLQNGVDNAERLAATLSREVIPACVYVAVEMAGAGHVRHHGRGELVIGRAAQSEDIAATFRAAAVPVDISANVARRALGQADRQLRVQRALGDRSAAVWRAGASAGVPDVMRDVADECLAVAQCRAASSCRATCTRPCAASPSTMPGQYSSTAQDLARGKPTEIDHLNGFVVRKARRSACRRR